MSSESGNLSDSGQGGTSSGSNESLNREVMGRTSLRSKRPKRPDPIVTASGHLAPDAGKSRRESMLSPHSPVPFSVIEPAISSGENTGGVNASMRIFLEDGAAAQYKPSAADATLSLSASSIMKVGKARVKGGITEGPVDYENLGEFIASAMGRAITSDPDARIVTPEVLLVGKQEGAKQGLGGIRILSKYIEKFSPFGDKKKFKHRDPRYVRLNFNEESAPYAESPAAGKPLRGYYPMGGERNAELRKGVSDGVALNILIGNADINAKGNIGNAIDGTKIGCIDFGHAFNSLIAGKAKGGGVHDTNGVLDYINRDKVLGGLSGGASKLWRDYEGLIPSQEFADSLRTIAGKADRISDGIADAQVKLAMFASDLKTPEEKAMLIKSLQRLNRNVGVGNVPVTDVQEVILDTLSNLANFAEKRCEQMQQVANLIDLQAAIDIEIKAKRDPLANEKIQREYASLKSSDLTDGRGSIRWAKTDEKSPPFVGTLESYIASRTIQINREQARISERAQVMELQRMIEGNEFKSSTAIETKFAEVNKQTSRGEGQKIKWALIDDNGKPFVGTLKEFLPFAALQTAKDNARELQAQIDSMLKDELKGKEAGYSDEMIEMMKKLENSPLKVSGNKITWPKFGEKGKSFVGDINEYKEMREAQLRKEQAKATRRSSGASVALPETTRQRSASVGGAAASFADASESETQQVKVSSSVLRRANSEPNIATEHARKKWLDKIRKIFGLDKIRRDFGKYAADSASTSPISHVEAETARRRGSFAKKATISAPLPGPGGSVH